MKLTKRILAMMLALAMVFALTACGDSSGGSSTTDPADGPVDNNEGGEDATEPEGGEETDPTPAETVDLNVDVFIYLFTDPYIASVRNEMEDMFVDRGITYNFHDGEENQTRQTEQVETALAQGNTDLLIVNLVDTGSVDAAMNIVNMAQDKGVPLIFFNREVDDEAINAYDKCVFVGTDADEAGYMQGEMIFDILSADFDAYDLNGDGQISYIMFKGQLGNPEADGRTTYSVEEANRLLAGAGLAELVYYDANNSDTYQACNWDSSEAQAAMATALGTNPFTGENPIELVIANNDEMALGAIEALNEVGYNTGSGDSIPVVGVDATTSAQAAIGEGKMAGTIEQSASGMASAIVELSVAVANGNELADQLGSFSNVDDEVAKIRIPYAKYTG